jgi:hypothetical protein
MKKLFKVGFLLIVLCFAVPVYAEGDIPTGNKACTQNCAGGLQEETILDPAKPDETEHEDSTILEIYSWIYEQISGITG